VRSRLPSHTVLDLLWYLAAPVVLLASSILFTAPILVVIAHAAGVHAAHEADLSSVGLFLFWYLLAFGPMVLLGIAYWRRAGDVSLPKSLVLAHLLTVYNYVWYAAAWAALARVTLGRKRWTKTVRESEASSVGPPEPVTSCR
jgi:hypothetical protein